MKDPTKKALVLIAGFLLSVIALSDAVESLGFYIDTSEGGSSSARLIKKLELYMSEAGCPVAIAAIEGPPESIFAIGFTALAPSPDRDKSSGTQKSDLLAINASGEYSQGVILIRAATGIDSLASLSGERFAFVGESSVTGFLDQLQLLELEGAVVERSKIMFTDNHLGAVSLLLHKDVFAVGVDATIADKWAAVNELKVIARGTARAVGGVVFNADIDPVAKVACQRALVNLQRDRQPGKSLLKLFPDWVNGFRLSE